MKEFNNIPMLRVDLESMRTSIVSAINDRHNDLVEIVNAGIDAAIIDLPPRLAKMAKDMSEEIMQDALQKALTEYWESGAGRNKINEMIAKKFK